ncbi:DNRLRE domain-containing protein [Croceimicrobium sp.]|uniref:DNRLRE domain-containing protein n=1 Tax=Croceimicrobium sp. TaxID=2828340 RepID=UPI003BADB73A
MKKIICLLSIFSTSLMAQSTVTNTFTPSKDAMIRQLGGVGDQNNYGTYPWVNMHAWTNSNQTVVHRSLIDFNLSSIANSSIVDSAFLILQVPPSGSQYSTGHYLQENNSCSVKRITEAWQEFQVNWINQPAVTSTNEVIMANSTSAYQSYRVDVTALVQDMVNNPQTSHGFYIQLLNEAYYRRMVFASSESSYSQLIPKLEVTHTSNVQTPVTTVQLPAKQDAMIREYNNAGDNTNYGNYRWNNMHAWSNNGSPVNHRSLIEFDLSAIPTAAILQSAYLELKMDRDPTASQYTSGHDFSSSNACVISRITTPWQEYQVTWNNQPSITNQNSINVPASTQAFQDYSIDVTSLVADMLADTSQAHGFYIQLQNETYYRRMVFASRDNPDSTAHPKLILNFSNGLSVRKEENLVDISVYPNPSYGEVTVSLPQTIAEKHLITFYDLAGQELLKQAIDQTSIKLNIERFNSGILIYRITNGAGYQVNTGKLILK